MPMSFVFDGSTSLESETTTTEGDVTAVARDNKATNLDGTVQTAHETRTIVKGSDNVVTEAKSTN